MRQQAGNKKRVPSFRNREVEAMFWDEIDLEDLAPDQLEEVEVDRHQTSEEGSA